MEGPAAMRVTVPCREVGFASVVSSGLGAAMGLGACVSAWGFSRQVQWAASGGLWLLGISLFHLGEYACVAYYRPRELRVTAFLLPGLGASREYNIAMLVSVCEFAIGVMLGRRHRPSVTLGGAVVMVLAALLRITGMAQCGSNFSHIIETNKREEHHLVDTGVYAWVRHPSYCGWFFWSIATQVTLLNPFSTVAYALAAYSFFRSRIPYEEAMLSSESYFGERYQDYKKRVWCGVPFIPNAPPGLLDSDNE